MSPSNIKLDKAGENEVNLCGDWSSFLSFPFLYLSFHLHFLFPSLDPHTYHSMHEHRQQSGVNSHIAAIELAAKEHAVSSIISLFSSYLHMMERGGKRGKEKDE